MNILLTLWGLEVCCLSDKWCLTSQELVGASGDGFLVIFVLLWLCSVQSTYCSPALEASTWPLTVGLSFHHPSPLGPFWAPYLQNLCDWTLCISFPALWQSIIMPFTCSVAVFLLLEHPHYEGRVCCCLVFQCLKEPNTEWFHVILLLNQ